MATKQKQPRKVPIIIPPKISEFRAPYLFFVQATVFDEKHLTKLSEVLGMKVDLLRAGIYDKKDREKIYSVMLSIHGCPKCHNKVTSLCTSQKKCDAEPNTELPMLKLFEKFLEEEAPGQFMLDEMRELFMCKQTKMCIPLLPTLHICPVCLEKGLTDDDLTEIAARNNMVGCKPTGVKNTIGSEYMSYTVTAEHNDGIYGNTSIVTKDSCVRLNAKINNSIVY